MQLLSFVYKIRGMMPEDSVLLIHELVPFGDKAGIIFPIEGKMRIHLSGDSLCNKNKSENIDLAQVLENTKYSYCLRRLFYSNIFPGELCAEVFETWDGIIHLMPFQNLSRREQFEFINQICMASDEDIDELDRNNDSCHDKALRIESSRKYSVRSFINTVKIQAGIFADIQIEESPGLSDGVITTMNLPCPLHGIKRIVIQSDKDKQHISQLALYGNLPFGEDSAIPQRVFDYPVFFCYKDELEGMDVIHYSVIENHLSSLERDAVCSFISVLNHKYNHLFRVDLLSLFNDILPLDTIPDDKEYYAEVRGALPNFFKESFTYRIIENIPLSNQNLDLNELKSLFGEIVQSQMTTLPLYRHLCIILNILQSNLRKYLKTENINILMGATELYFGDNPDCSDGGDIEFDSGEGADNHGHTGININEDALRIHIGKDCLPLLDELSRFDINESFIAKEPLKEYLWWGRVGPAFLTPDFPNVLNECGYRFIALEYDLQ